MRRMILAVGFISVFLLGAHEAVSQCTCAMGPGSVRLSAHEAFKTSEVVFTGEVIEVKEGASVNEYEVTFKVQTVWKKDVGEAVVLRTYRGSCGFFGEKGDEYLIYAYTSDGMLTTDGCTRTKGLARASADLKEFEEKGEKPVKTYDTKPPEP
jgi:hypothetical protein